MKIWLALDAVCLALLACQGTAQAPAPNGRCYAFSVEAPGLSVTADYQGRWYVSKWHTLHALGEKNDAVGCVARRLINLRDSLPIRTNDVAWCFMLRSVSDDLADRAIGHVVHACGFSKSGAVREET